MTTPRWSRRRLHAVHEAQMNDLADVLIDCVLGDCSGQIPVEADGPLAPVFPTPVMRIVF